MRSAGPKRHESQQAGRHNPMKHKRRPPKGMYLDQEDLMAMVSGPPGQAEAILKALDSEIVSLKRQVRYRCLVMSIVRLCVCVCVFCKRGRVLLFSTLPYQLCYMPINVQLRAMYGDFTLCTQRNYYYNTVFSQMILIDICINEEGTPVDHLHHVICLLQ